MGYFLPHPIMVERAKGAWLWDVDGHSVLRDPNDLVPSGVPAHAADEVVEIPFKTRMAPRPCSPARAPTLPPSSASR